MVKHKHTYKIQCQYCGQFHYVQAFDTDVNKWQEGMFIQDAMPYLTPDERELFISKMCSECWEKFFGTGK